MTTNIVTAKFYNSRRTTTRPLTQYDYGQILRIEGIDLPDAYEVDFSNNQYTGDSKPQLGDASGVAIPEEYIKTGKDIYAFIYLHAGESDGETFYWIKIPNELRPARTEETPTPEEQSIIDQTIAALNTGVQKVEDIADGLEEQIDTALQEAKDSGEFDGEDGISPEVTIESITGGHRVTVVDKDGTETFDVMDGEDGDTGRGIVTIEKTSTSGLVDTYTITYSDNTTGTFYVTNGENGDPGSPGFSPVVAISSITGGHRVTITSATGTDSFDVLDGVDGENGNGIASVELNDDYTLTLIFTNGTSYTTSSIRGEPGENGVSPTASVTQTATGATITVTDARGTTTANLTNGQNGDPGISPTVTVTDITGGHRITITDADGAHSFDVMDGDVADAPVQSVNGQTGAVVLDAQDVGAYEKPVSGIPKIDLESNVQASLGKADTALQSAPVTSVNSKTGAVVLDPSDIGAASEADVAAKYTKPTTGIPASDLAAGVIPAVPVQDVQVNGVSVLSDGVANVPIAGDNTYGAVRTNGEYGVYVNSSGFLQTSSVSSAQIKSGVNTTRAIKPVNQHESTFYGLSKVAGIDLANETVSLGTYPDSAKAAIKTMLGVTDPAVSDVQVNGTSILDAQGVANVPMASISDLGVVKVNRGFGIMINPTTGDITVAPASSAEAKGGAEVYKAITPIRQHESAFYGLAKAAGDTTQASSDNAVGTYTDDAKAAIQQMLDVPSTDDIPTVPVQDVQVNNVSILNDGVANIPVAAVGVYGTVKITSNVSNSGISMDEYGNIIINGATSGLLKQGTNTRMPVVASRQHESVFYGLAKAAGDATQSSSSNAVGNYTDAAKSAISQMLNTPVSVTGTTPTITALPGIRYVCGEVAMLSFTPSATGVCDVVFTSGSTPTVVTLPNTVKLPDWFTVAGVESNRTYEINILDGVYGTVTSWS